MRVSNPGSDGSWIVQYVQQDNHFTVTPLKVAIVFEHINLKMESVLAVLTQSRADTRRPQVYSAVLRRLSK